MPKTKNKNKINKGNPAWTPFVQTTPNITQEMFNADPQNVAETISMFNSGQMKMYQNGLYTVMVRTLDANNNDGVIHLSIRHNDRKPIRDWRHFQRIKNELVGEEREALEIYPAESRLVDEANQYHLWVLPTGQVFPFGFNEGRIAGNSESATEVGASQRDYEAPPLSDGMAMSANLDADATITKAKPQQEGELITSEGQSYVVTPPTESRT